MGACGGGGGTGGGIISTTSTGVVVPAPVAPPAFLASSIATTLTTYATTEQEVQDAFTRLSTERIKCGFGALDKSSQLETAAKNHADWQNLNNTTSHYESAGTTGFTGVYPIDRTTFAGYAGTDVTDDLVAVVGTNLKTGRGESDMRQLLLAPYHQMSLLRGWRDIGIAVRSSADVSVSFAAVVLQVNLGYTPAGGKQLPSTSDVLTYPCDGVTRTNRSLTSESPQVEPSRNYLANPTGQPIAIMVREGNILSINSYLITDALTSTVVASKLLNSANDVNSRIRGNEAIVIPDVPLNALSSYIVNISGTNNGASFARSFTFTTGP